jgi:hypothetical protein
MANQRFLIQSKGVSLPIKFLLKYLNSIKYKFLLMEKEEHLIIFSLEDSGKALSMKTYICMYM